MLSVCEASCETSYPASCPASCETSCAASLFTGLFKSGNPCDQTYAGYVSDTDINNCPSELLLLKQLNRLKTKGAEGTQTAAESCS